MRSRLSPLIATLTIVVLAPSVPARATVDTYVDDNNTRFEAYIETASTQGLIVGCNPPSNDRICPDAPMTRGEMVLILARALGLSPKSGEMFTNRAGQLGPFAISALAAAGISNGCRGEGSCPDRTLTRGEMASLISRAFRWGTAQAPDRFVDIVASPYRDALANLAERGGLLTCDSPVSVRLCPSSRVTRDEALFAIVTVLGLDPAPIERAEPDPPPLGFGDSFDSLSLWDGRAPSYRNRVRLTTDGYRDSGLRVSIPTGSHYGADFNLHLEDATANETDRLFFRYYLKLDPDWHTAKSGKLPGFSGIYGSSGKGGYPSSPLNPGWSARLMFSPALDDDPRVGLGYYVYHLGQETRYGDGVGWNEAGRLRPGEWYCLEGQVELNTLGLADGSLRAWVDGTPALDFEGLEFRRSDEPEIKIESFWFNVYYGGKQVPEHDLGLTIDEVEVDTHRVGCGAGEGRSQPTIGDFNGDSYPDSVSWKQCPEGICLEVTTRFADGSSSVEAMRDTPWFSLETDRLGAAAGDVDGDGRDELVYRGRCANSTRCWRVRRDLGNRDGTTEDWGDDARFSGLTGTPSLGDWNGDGTDDLAYQGTCGQDAHLCWRVQSSTGDSFGSASDWGATPTITVTPISTDLDGDGRDDLVYRAGCDGGRCWYAQMSSGSSFDEPTVVGAATEESQDGLQFFDFDGDGTSDLISWPEDDAGTTIEARFGSEEGLSAPVVLAELDDPVEEVHMERVVDGSPVTATVRHRCGEDECVDSLYGASSRRLVDRDRFRTVMQRRTDVPAID